MAEFSISEGSFDPIAATEDTRSFGDVSAGLLPPAPKGPETPPVGFDETTNMVFVNGFEFDADDHDSALRSKKALSGPLVPMPQNYRPVDVKEFGGYIQRIQDPSIGRIIKKNFGIGVDNLQLLAGRGLQFAGAEETGQKIVDQQIEDLRFTQPYQRLFTDIDSAGGAVEWFVANLAQQGPMLIESALSAIVGGIIGGLAFGVPNPFTAVGGAFLALSGKAAVKKAVIEAARKHAAGETLDIAEKKLLREVASGAVARELKLNAKKISPTILSKEGVIKDFLGEAGLVRGGAEALKRGKLQARIGGAIIGRYVNSLGIGVSDIYGEQIESGTENRGAAFGLAIPYALAESIPELLGLGFFIRGGKSLATGVSKAGRKAKKVSPFTAAGVRALKRTGRAAAGGGIAAFGEGTTEAFQEALLLSQNPEVDAGSAEGINRLINSFAAGAGVGGALGVVGGAIRGRRALEGDNRDILNPDVRIGPALLEGPDTPLQIEDQRPPPGPILQGGPPLRIEDQRPPPGPTLQGGPVAPVELAAPVGPAQDALGGVDPQSQLTGFGARLQQLGLGDKLSDFKGVQLTPEQRALLFRESEAQKTTPVEPGASEEETQAFLANQLQAPSATPLEPGLRPLQQRLEQDAAQQEADAAVAATPIQGELPYSPEVDLTDFPAEIALLQGPVWQRRDDKQQEAITDGRLLLGLQGAQNPLRPTVKGEEAIFVGDRAVPVRQLLATSAQRKKALKELQQCLKSV